MRAGDRDTYIELRRRHFDALRRQAKRISRSGDEADRLAIDVFTRFYLDTSAGGGPVEAVRPYLYRLLHSIASVERRPAPSGANPGRGDGSEFLAYVGVAVAGAPDADVALRARCVRSPSPPRARCGTATSKECRFAAPRRFSAFPSPGSARSSPRLDATGAFATSSCAPGEGTRRADAPRSHRSTTAGRSVRSTPTTTVDCVAIWRSATGAPPLSIAATALETALPN